MSDSIQERECPINLWKFQPMIVDNLIANLGRESTGENELNRFRQSMDEMAKHFAAFADLIAHSVLSFGNSVIAAATEFRRFGFGSLAQEGNLRKARDPLGGVPLSEFVLATPYEADALGVTRLGASDTDPTSRPVQAVDDATADHFDRSKDFATGIQGTDNGVAFRWTIKSGETMSKAAQDTGADTGGHLQGRVGDGFTNAIVQPSQASHAKAASIEQDGTRSLINAGGGPPERLERWIDFFDKVSTVSDVVKSLSATPEEMKENWKKSTELSDALEPYTPRGILNGIMENPKRFFFGAAADGGSLRDHLKFDIPYGAFANTSNQSPSPPAAEDLAIRMDNFQRNTAKVEGVAPGNAVVGDCCQDNRNQSINVTVNQTIQQATDAPAAVAQATAEAARNAALNAAMERRPSRLEMEPNH